MLITTVDKSFAFSVGKGAGSVNFSSAFKVAICDLKRRSPSRSCSGRIAADPRDWGDGPRTGPPAGQHPIHSANWDSFHQFSVDILARLSTTIVSIGALVC